MARSTGMPPLLRDNQATVYFTNVSLKGVLVRAYNLMPGDITGPSWLDERRFDIVAKPPEGATKEQVAVMLQGLLADRFRMRVHWDTAETQGFALVVAKNGPKLKSTGLAPGDSDNRPPMSVRFGAGWIGFEYNRETLEGFARSLGVAMGKPVADMTGIKGEFDISFECSTDFLAGLPPRPASPDSEARPSIFSAIYDLGLNLESRKVPAKRLVVDSAEKIPTEN